MNDSLEKENNGQNQQEINKLLKQHELDLKALKNFYHGYNEKFTEHYDVVQEIDSLDIITIYNAGVSLEKQNLFEESITYFSKVLELKSVKQINKESELI